MSAKKIYFVRHGESVGNTTDIYHDPAGELSELGREQATFLGKRFQSIPIDKIIASHYERAQETAKIIAEHTGKSVETLELLAEKRRAKSFFGVPPEHPKRQVLKDTDPRHFDETFRFEEDETFPELKQRALKLIEHLVGRQEHTLLCVTHGWFIRIVMGVMLHGETLTGKEAHRLWKFLKTENTGVTLCVYDENNLNNGWRLHTWMDQAHLGEPKD